jgi:chromosome segregation ATPase
MTDTEFLTSHGFSQEQAEALQTWAAAREATFSQRIDTVQTTLNRVALGMEGVARDVTRGFAGLGAQIDGVHTRLGGIEDGLHGVEDRLDGVEDRLERVENRLDAVDNRLDGVENRLDRVENRLGGVENRLERIEDHFQAPPEAV